MNRKILISAIPVAVLLISVLVYNLVFKSEPPPITYQKLVKESYSPVLENDSSTGGKTFKNFISRSVFRRAVQVNG